MLILLIVHLTIYTVDAGKVIIQCYKKHLKHSSHIIVANICYMYLVRSKYARSISERCILFICCLLGYLLVLVYSVTRYFYFIIVKRKIILMFCNLQQLVQSKSFLALTKSIQQQCTMTQPALQLPIMRGLHQKPLSHVLGGNLLVSLPSSMTLS